MADTSLGITDAAGTTKQVDVFSQANGDLREAVVIGDPASTAAASVLGSLPGPDAVGVCVRQVGPAPLGTEAPVCARGTIAASTTSQQMWPPRAGRLGGQMFNASDGNAYISYEATSSVETADVIIGPSQLFELPNGQNLRITQAVSVVWASAATGSVRTVEWY